METEAHVYCLVGRGREALKTESSECFLLFGPWGWDVDILGTSENQRLKCSVRGRAVVDGCLGQLKVINREGRAGASMQVPGIIWVNNRKPLSQRMAVPEYSVSR